MTKTLYLMRHGQTLFNVEHKIQGWCDSPLTDLGIKQAEEAANTIDDLGLVFDHCYSSTSERACDTLEIATRGKYSYERVKGLKEWNFGNFEAMDEFLNPPLPYGDFFAGHGGERQTEVAARMVKTLTEIMERPDHETVLAVSHGASIANFIRSYNQYNEKKLKPGIPNCTLFKLSYEDGHFSLLDYFVPNLR